MAVTPEDVFPDSLDSAQIGDSMVRKGSVRAALVNAAIMNTTSSTVAEKRDAKKAFSTLIPSLIALEMHEHVVWKNPELQEMIDAELTKQNKQT